LFFYVVHSLALLSLINRYVQFEWHGAWVLFCMEKGAETLTDPGQTSVWSASGFIFIWLSIWRGGQYSPSPYHLPTDSVQSLHSLQLSWQES